MVRMKNVILIAELSFSDFLDIVEESPRTFKGRLGIEIGG